MHIWILSVKKFYLSNQTYISGAFSCSQKAKEAANNLLRSQYGVQTVKWETDGKGGHVIKKGTSNECS